VVLVVWACTAAAEKANPAAMIIEIRRLDAIALPPIAGWFPAPRSL
jgi:hypothetical protein